jgi:hypothetical protein
VEEGDGLTLEPDETLGVPAAAGCVPAEVLSAVDAADADEVETVLIVAVEADPKVEPAGVVEPDTAAVPEASRAAEDVETLPGLADWPAGLEGAGDGVVAEAEPVTAVSVANCVVTGSIDDEMVAVAQAVRKPLSS